MQVEETTNCDFFYFTLNGESIATYDLLGTHGAFLSIVFLMSLF